MSNIAKKLGNTERLLRTIEYDLEHDKEIIEGFAKALLDNPLYNLSWADKVLRSAARSQIRTYVKASLNKGDSIKDIHDGLILETLRMAAHVPSSSSGMDNLCRQHERAAYAEFASTVSRFKE